MLTVLKKLNVCFLQPRQQKEVRRGSLLFSGIGKPLL